MAPKFGTSGLRGLVVELTEALITDYTRAFASSCDTGNAVSLGWDLRASSPHMAKVVADALCALGLTVENCGAVPTPALAYHAGRRGNSAIMVTGSHIPADRNGLKFYTPTGEITHLEQDGILGALGAPGREGKLGQVIDVTDCETAYVARYVDAFGSAALAGLKIGIYEHSSVARDVLHDIVRGLGGATVSLGRSEVFIPVDTEAIDPASKTLLAGWIEEHQLDAIFSTDGDADRPMVTGQDGKIVLGDVLGPLTATLLGANTICTPISSNSLVSELPQFTRVDLCRIGSPHVIAAMAVCSDGNPGAKIAGYEANGGFLLGFDADCPAGALAALMTRDAVLPAIAPLMLARQRGVSLADLVASLPPRFTAADRLQDVQSSLTLGFIDKVRANTEARRSFFDTMGQEVSINLLDGMRITFDNSDVIHLRPSGNAPECRVYVEAGSPDRAAALLTEYLGKVELAVIAL